jgi:protein involved in polysaccharide export with SLBB domain
VPVNSTASLLPRLRPSIARLGFYSAGAWSDTATVTVIGVKQSGIYAIPEPATVRQALDLARGLPEIRSVASCRIVRQAGLSEFSYFFGNNRDLFLNFELRNGDVLLIGYEPQARPRRSAQSARTI